LRRFSINWGPSRLLTPGTCPNLTAAPPLPWLLREPSRKSTFFFGLSVRYCSISRALLFDGSDSPLPTFLSRFLLGQAKHDSCIGSHNWVMHASLVAAADRESSWRLFRARLDAFGCFKAAVKNRKTGRVGSGPMCAMNEGGWSHRYAERPRIADRQSS